QTRGRGESQREPCLSLRYQGDVGRGFSRAGFSDRRPRGGPRCPTASTMAKESGCRPVAANSFCQGPASVRHLHRRPMVSARFLTAATEPRPMAPGGAAAQAQPKVKDAGRRLQNALTAAPVAMTEAALEWTGPFASFQSAHSALPAAPGVTQTRDRPIDVRLIRTAGRSRIPTGGCPAMSMAESETYPGCSQTISE